MDNHSDGFSPLPQRLQADFHAATPATAAARRGVAGTRVDASLSFLALHWFRQDAGNDTARL
jgi:hypothetical protein